MSSPHSLSAAISFDFRFRLPEWTARTKVASSRALRHVPTIRTVDICLQNKAKRNETKPTFLYIFFFRHHPRSRFQRSWSKKKQTNKNSRYNAAREKPGTVQETLRSKKKRKTIKKKEKKRPTLSSIARPSGSTWPPSQRIKGLAFETTGFFTAPPPSLRGSRIYWVFLGRASFIAAFIRSEPFLRFFFAFRLLRAKKFISICGRLDFRVFITETTDSINRDVNRVDVAPFFF